MVPKEAEVLVQYMYKGIKYTIQFSATRRLTTMISRMRYVQLQGHAPQNHLNKFFIIKKRFLADFITQNSGDEDFLELASVVESIQEGTYIYHKVDVGVNDIFRDSVYISIRP